MYKYQYTDGRIKKRIFLSIIDAKTHKHILIADFNSVFFGK